MQISNILTRNELNQIYPNLQRVTNVDLRNTNYIRVMLGTFNSLISELQRNALQRNAFDNLPILTILYLSNNPIITLDTLLSEQYYDFSKYVKIRKY
jgi:hypothetical protein